MGLRQGLDVPYVPIYGVAITRNEMIKDERNEKGDRGREREEKGRKKELEDE